MPGGKELGVRNPGAKDNIRTLEKSEFDALKSELLSGAKEIVAPSDYDGRWFQRHDGSVVGVRDSVKSGNTIDIVRSSEPTLKPGYKVHVK